MKLLHVGNFIIYELVLMKPRGPVIVNVLLVDTLDVPYRSELPNHNDIDCRPHLQFHSAANCRRVFFWCLEFVAEIHTVTSSKLTNIAFSTAFGPGASRICRRSRANIRIHRRKVSVHWDSSEVILLNTRL